MAAALVGMVARLTVDKKKYADVEPQMQSVLDRAERLRAGLTQAARDDAAAFVAVRAAMQLPKATPAEQAARAEAIEAGYLHATEVPLKVARDAVATMNLAIIAAEVGNINAMSDAASGAFMARAAIDAAGMNVRINAASLDDKAVAQKYVADWKSVQSQAAVRIEQILAQVEQRAALA